MLLGELIDRYVSFLRATKAARTVTAYEGDLRALCTCLETIAGRSAEELDIGSIDTQLLVDGVAEFRNRPDGRYKDPESAGAGTQRSAAAVGRFVSVLRGMFAWAYEQELVPNDPAALLKRPKAGRRLPKALSEQEALLLLQAVDGIAAERAEAADRRGARWWAARNRVVVGLAVGCGLRRSEISGLLLSEVTGRPPAAVTVRGKGDKERRIPLPGFVSDWIVDYLPERDLLLRETGAAAGTLVVSTKPRLVGESLTLDASDSVPEYVVDRCLQWLGRRSPGIRVHALRHTFATLGLSSGALNIRQMQELLGHSDLSTTQAYTHVTDDELDGGMRLHPLSTRTGPRGRNRPRR